MEKETFDLKLKTHSTYATDYEVALLEEDMTPQKLSEGKTFQLLVYNDEQYKEYQIGFTTLPIVKIELEDPPGDENNPIGIEDAWAKFELYDNREGVAKKERLVKSYTYVRLRGASSLRYPQKQMRLNLRDLSISGEESNQHLSLLGMREDDDWILYAPYSDPEKIRDTFSTNLWYETSAQNNSLDVDNGTEGKFVEVFIGDRYWGAYTLMFPIDEKQLDLDKDKGNSLESDFYYRIFSNVAPQEETFKQSGNSLIAGSVELRYPDEPLNDYRQWEPLMQHLDAMAAGEEPLRDYMQTKAELPNQIDYFLFYTLTQAHDNDTKNRNYMAYWEEGQHLMLESPWDLDLTWGNRWTQEHALNVQVRGHAGENLVLRPSLITRALELGMTDISEEVIQRYKELRETVWSEEHLLHRLEQYEHDIYGSGAAARNHARWPGAAYAEDASALKQYVENRLVHMDRFIYETVQGGALHDRNR
ncbi:CotH kinase family protein [Atopococcus tabaci]|uniref:CotH kinase family protein n=1 Tax=Atopococcus tabaci TaxID=269774 RepID=UPI0003FEF73B|nr:CotH kinase family protein [Atopococcus tabaci]